MSAILEIKSYLQNKDYSIANRRILDFAFQTNQQQLLQTAIENSKMYHVALQKNDVLDNWVSQCAELLDQLAKAPKEAKQSQKLIDASNITKTYNKGNFSLSDISVALPSHYILGVVGENGNGKTTLLRCLSGQLQIEEGKLNYPFLGQYDYYKLKSEIAFIPQRIPKWHGLLKDNLHFSASICGTVGAENNLMVDFMLERFNLSAYANLTWNQISSGYRTRFEIARILLQKPKLLILDEPLANLDIKAQQTLLTDLKMLTKHSGQAMGIILSSQQLHEVEKVADEVLMIKQGKQVETNQILNTTTNDVVLEIETLASFEQLTTLLGADVSINFNGGFYTLHTTTQTANQLLQQLSANLEISYFRNITHSTKRFF